MLFGITADDLANFGDFGTLHGRLETVRRGETPFDTVQSISVDQ